MNLCTCVMCSPCLERTVEHHESDPDVPAGQIRCPGCRENADPAAEFVAMDLVGKSRPKLRMFTLPVVVRTEGAGEGARLLGHPWLLHLPNQITGARLYELVGPMVRVDQNWELVLVDQHGRACSR